MDTNARLNTLIGKYGNPTIDFFGNTWRIWFQSFHIHMKFNFGIGGSQGGFAGQGATLDQAMDRLEAQAAEVEPSSGFYCGKECPYYDDPVY